MDASPPLYHVCHYICHESYPSFNIFDNSHHTPLQMASANSSAESVECLLKAGSTVELPDNDGDTALIIACQNGSNEDVINLLLDYAKDVNVANRNGLTALHYAVQRKYSKAYLPEALSKSFRRRPSGLLLRSRGFPH